MKSKTDRRPLTEEEILWRDNLKATWKRVKKERAEIGVKVTQDIAAEHMEITQSAVGQYLRGDIPLNVAAVINFSSYLGSSPVDIDPKLEGIKKSN